MKEELIAALSTGGDSKKPKKPKKKGGKDSGDGGANPGKGKSPPGCTVCGEDVKHWFKDCPIIKKAKELNAPESGGAVASTSRSGARISSRVQFAGSDSEDDIGAPMVHLGKM